MEPELIVRKIVHSSGKRFRLHGAFGADRLPGRPDLVFARLRKVIFVHGCFWHQHSAAKCKIVRKPKTNTTYWNQKLLRNVERDAEHLAALKKAGWRTLVIWECEIERSGELATKLSRFLSEETPTKSALR